MILSKLSDAPIGSVVEFNYMGGSQYGATRKVEVTEVFNYGILGKDFDRGMDFRHFDNCKARNPRVIQGVTPQAKVCVQVVSTPFNVALQELRNKLDQLTLEQLAEIFALHRGGTNPNVNKPACTVTYETPVKTFNVNGQVLTLAELSELVKANS
jgi:hypothetical protein